MVINELAGATFPNIQGYVSYTYDNAVTVVPSIITALTAFVIVMVLMIMLSKCFSQSKSRTYRELMTDMYVVGMIKKFAKDDELDLVAEIKEFNRMLKKDKLKDKQLDEVVESELKDKIAKVSEEELAKKDKEKK